MARLLAGICSLPLFYEGVVIIQHDHDMHVIPIAITAYYRAF